MSITFRKADEMFIGLSTDDKTAIESVGNIIYYVDTQAAEIYDNGSWNTYTLPVGGGGGGGLVAEATLTGATTTISDLDIITDGGNYDIYITGITTSTTAGLLMYINGDTTPTNYYNGQINATGTVNNASINFATAYTGAISSNVRIMLGLDASDYASATSFGESRYSSGVGGSSYHWIHANTQTNVTSITFALSGGATFSTGTVKIYKR